MKITISATDGRVVATGRLPITAVSRTECGVTVSLGEIKDGPDASPFLADLTICHKDLAQIVGDLDDGK